MNDELQRCLLYVFVTVDYNSIFVYIVFLVEDGESFFPRLPTLSPLFVSQCLIHQLDDAA